MKIVPNYERSGYEVIGIIRNGLKSNDGKYHFFDINGVNGKTSYMVLHDDFYNIFNKYGHRVMNQLQIENIALSSIECGISFETAKQLLEKVGK